MTSERLSAKDWRFVAVCVVLAGICIAIVARYFSTAFPEAAIDFKFDRNTSRAIAEQLLAREHVSVANHKHAVRFDSDDLPRIFLERSLGLENAKRVLRDQLRVWTWHHRWFQPLVEEEVSVDVAPTGEIVGYSHKLPEARAATGTRAPIPFLQSIGVNTADLSLVSTSERNLPKRVQRIYTFESKSIRPAGAPYRHIVTIDGDVVTDYTQQLKVPDAWQRSYRELRSKNSAAGAVDTILMVATMLAAVVIFIVRLRRGDMRLGFLLAVGVAGLVLFAADALNSMPSQLAYYDTTQSYSAYLSQLLFLGVLIPAIGTAMFLIVIGGAGEVLYRERLPQHLAIPRLWTPKALASKRVFRSLILGNALVPLFIAYQVVFYLVASRFGAWSPAEVPYDDRLSTAFPWAAVLLAGFFPAFSEEFLSRAFSIPFLQRFVKWRMPAIVIAAFIWGFGHSTYANQPFWIRGVEVGLAGIAAGLIMERFGLLALLIWHYTIDAVYTATLLFASGNTYYVVSAGLASLIFLVPLLASIALYLRNRGFVPDDDLTNAALPVHPAPPHEEVQVAAAEFPPAAPPSGLRWALCVALVAAAVIAISIRPRSPNDAVDYRIDKNIAKDIAKKHVGRPFQYVIALPVEGFRSWDPSSRREDGGAPGDFDDIAATYLVQHGVDVEQLILIFRDNIEAGTWMVRFFTPMQKEEIFVEVDPRRGNVVGYHKYQDEAKPGPSLTEAQAVAIARAAFRRYGVHEETFELKEALTFAQPKRRDWLLHFQERVPLAPNAYRRVTVRVAGAEVTQLNKTIKIPESVYREASTQTLLNVILLILKIVGSVALLAIVIAGIVIASRRHGLPWRRAARWTLVLAIIPIAAMAARYESSLFTYSTSVAWETFRVSQLTGFIAQAGVRIGLIFLALAGLEAAVPYALSLVTREGRARFGKAAVLAALTAISILVIADVAAVFIAHKVPSAAVVEISAPDEVTEALPALIETGIAIAAAIVFSGAVALMFVTLQRYAGLILIATIFCATVDPSATLEQTPLMLVRALLMAVLVWIIARYVLGKNPLAWPLFVFLILVLKTISILMQHMRFDLRANAIAMMIFVVIAIAWAWRENARVV
jgi:membrane protease YdiL (CAAX protease family)